jgi:deazaflavin-dependent oxidoreductase (nitroreductase family)
MPPVQDGLGCEGGGSLSGAGKAPLASEEDPMARIDPKPFRALVVPFVLVWGAAVTARHFLRGIKRRAGELAGATGGEQSLPRMERIKTSIEHELDTQSAALSAGLIRATKGRIARLWRRRVLVLTTHGRKSGKERTVPLQFFPDGDDMIIVAANSGLPSPPGWYFNLTADPRARVDVEGRTLRVRAEELSADEAAAFWPRVLQVAPDYARYPRRTSRRIPLIRLVSVTPTTSSVTAPKPSAGEGGR